MPGKFITFEGPEGSGKSTQIQLLVEKLEQQGIRATCSREPGGTATGEQIRNLLQHDAAGEPLADRAELLLFTASRAQLMDRVILPILDTGDWVVCDRFIDSTMAYQGYARGMDIATLDAINAFAIYDKKPDLTILLDLDIEVGFQRLEKRYAGSGESHDRFELEARDFHRRVRDGYQRLAEREDERFCVIDANLPISEVASEVWNAVKGALL
ncbi:dTMP kinase [Pontiella agarivorans]|uniref:Thymidylate kinase n=1 Tax=Pontiella agarivorans TaxID=3038953 RepID=A0ABU5N041_9BACT|nr:dTMP kinase [Pontiella agarivorans]MDZ8119778.1 dTMP kinase [Pontiella agarivorans]